MLFGDFKRFIYALSDCNGRNNDDKLGKAVTLMQLKNRLGVNLSLSGTSLHLHTEGKTRLAVIIENIVRHRQVVSSLNLVHILKQRCGGNVDLIPNAQVEQALLVHRDFKGRGQLLLTFEQINDRIHRVGLKLLVFKL